VVDKYNYFIWFDLMKYSILNLEPVLICINLIACIIVYIVQEPHTFCDLGEFRPRGFHLRWFDPRGTDLMGHRSQGH